MNHENIRLSDEDIIEVLYIAYKKLYYHKSTLCDTLSYSLYICTSKFISYLNVINFIPEFNSKFLVGREISDTKEWWNINDKTSRLEALTKLIDIYTLKIFERDKKPKNKKPLNSLKEQKNYI